MKFFRPLLCALLLLTLTACASRTGPPGSPLPLPNKAVSDKWSPEVREFIDVFTTRFASGQPMPTDEQIEQWLHVRTVAQTPPYGVAVYRRIFDWPLGGVDDGGRSRYQKLEPRVDGRQRMDIGMSVDTSRYCINPYDLAIYTGFRFIPEIESPPSHGPVPDRPRDQSGRVYEEDYVWGMFNRAPNRSYEGNHFLGIHLNKELRCIDWIGVNTTFQANPLLTRTN